MEGSEGRRLVRLGRHEGRFCPQWQQRFDMSWTGGRRRRSWWWWRRRRSSSSRCRCQGRRQKYWLWSLAGSLVSLDCLIFLVGRFITFNIRDKLLPGSLDTLLVLNFTLSDWEIVILLLAPVIIFLVQSASSPSVSLVTAVTFLVRS